MKGISYVTDERGQRTAVLMDLRQFGEIWEDLYDTIVAMSREKETRKEWRKIRKPYHKKEIYG